MTEARKVPFKWRRVGRCLEYVTECGLHWRLPSSVPVFSPERVRNILIAHHYEIGDVLCITPSLRALRRAFPAARLAILVAENCRPIVERNPDADEIFAYRRAKYQSGRLDRLVPRDLVRVMRDLRSQHFDLAISMRRPYSNTNALLVYASGAPWRLGYLPPVSHPFGYFLNLGRPPADKVVHEVDSGLELLASIGVPSAGRELTLVPDPDVQRLIRERVGTARVDGVRLAFVHISSRREPNRWPLVAFAQVADALRERYGFTVLLSWAPGDATNPLFPGDDGKAEKVAGLMRTRPILLKTPNLTELIAAMSVCDFVLSPDGGCVHIAAALGIPQIALFGKAYLDQWRPINPRSIVLHGGGRADRITVDEVVAAATTLLSQPSSGGSGRTSATAMSRALTADAAAEGQTSSIPEHDDDSRARHGVP